MAATGLGAAAGTRWFGPPAIFADGSPNATLGVAVIGCGGRGRGTHVPVAARDERLVALVDVVESNLAASLKHATRFAPGFNPSSVQTFVDYRRLYDKLAKEIDVVFIATPNHHHALPALTAMQLGKHVYVEKPLCHNIREGRLLLEFAHKYKVATQMGNQGRSLESQRRLCEYIWGGTIGTVTEVHAWTNRANGGVGPRPPALPVPAGMHWDEWIGPAPYRDYHVDLHPHEWHTWYDFGNGSPGNMGCHMLDAAFAALKLNTDHYSAEVESLKGGTAERYPIGNRIRYDFPASEGMPAARVYWYDGQRKDVQNPAPDPHDAMGTYVREACNRPALVQELEKKYNRDFGPNGTIYVGDKGIIYTGLYCDNMRIVPEEQHKATPPPPKTLPRVKGTHQGDFLRACRGGEPASSNFDYSVWLNEMILMGCLAIRAGEGRKVEWSRPAMRCTNQPELNRYLDRESRKGWELPQV